MTRSAAAAPLSLDSDWMFAISASASDLGPEESEWRTIDLPHRFDPDALASIDHPDGGRSAWYRRVVDMPARWVGRWVTLEIVGADPAVTVYLNGIPIGEGRSEEDAHRVAVSRALRRGRNELLLRIDSPIGSDTGTVLRGGLDSIAVHVAPAVHIRTAVVHDADAEDRDGHPSLSVRADIAALHAVRAQVQFAVFQASRLIATMTVHVALADGVSRITDAIRWTEWSRTPDRLRTRLIVEDRLADEIWGDIAAEHVAGGPT